MAENAHLYLKINGTAVAGDSTSLSDGSIELQSVSWGVHAPIDWQLGSYTGRREYSAVSASKRIDKASPLMFKALTTNQIVEGTIKFFRPTAAGDAVSENFYTLDFKAGRIESISQGAGGSDIPTETIAFAFRSFTMTYDTKGAKGITNQDDWQKKT
jgi:type VI secretion system secreted protein Hcp